MNNELNKVFGRDFVIGFFLPALVFLVLTSLLFSAVSKPISWLKLNPDDLLKDSASLALITFVAGVLLQSANRELFRLLEGYWPKPIRDSLSKFEKRRFRKLKKEGDSLLKEKNEHKSKHPKIPFKSQGELNDVWRRLNNQFPSREDLVLPTSFGNTVRAYEDYPRVMYGFESIMGWARLQPLIGKQTTESLGQVRARLDMWLNLIFVTLGILVEILILAFYFKQLQLLWFVLACVPFGWFSYSRSRSSAERYGEQVKAIYDLYLRDLCTKLGFVVSPDPETNRQFWQAFSRGMVYREAEAVKAMTELGLKRAPVALAKAEKADEGDPDTDA